MIGDAPWVQCAEYADTGSISCVGINDVEAAQGAVSRLADSGRRRIALINHDLSFSVLVFDFGSFLLTGTKLTPEVSSAYYENGGIVRFRMEGNFKYSYIRGV